MKFVFCYGWGEFKPMGGGVGVMVPDHREVEIKTLEELLAFIDNECDGAAVIDANRKPHPVILKDFEIPHPY